MGGSFVLFDVSMEITLGSFGLGKAATHKNVLARGQTPFTHGLKGYCNHDYYFRPFQFINCQ